MAQSNLDNHLLPTKTITLSIIPQSTSNNITISSTIVSHEPSLILNSKHTLPHNSRDVSNIIDSSISPGKKISLAIDSILETRAVSHIPPKIKNVVYDISKEHGGLVNANSFISNNILNNEKYRDPTSLKDILDSVKKFMENSNHGDLQITTSLLMIDHIEFLLNNIKQKILEKYEDLYNIPYVPIKTVAKLSRGERNCINVINEIYPNHKFLKIRHPNIINPSTNRPLELDLYNEELRIAFEYNGKQHYQYIPHFHGDISNFNDQQSRDNGKIALCTANGIKLIIIPYTCDTKKKISNYIRRELNLPIDNSIMNITRSNRTRIISEITYPILNIDKLENSKIGNPQENVITNDNLWIIGTLETLKTFIRNCIIRHENSGIIMKDFLMAYKEHCRLNKIRCQYRSEDTSSISRHLSLIEPSMRPIKKQIDYKRYKIIFGYKFNNA
jgi:hypothetical protein